ncbi:blue light receptor [Onygenales sp. PD_12]|nr:blue light receptor [Onygenales sp. PD_12]
MDDMGGFGGGQDHPVKQINLTTPPADSSSFGPIFDLPRFGSDANIVSNQVLGESFIENRGEFHQERLPQPSNYHLPHNMGLEMAPPPCADFAPYQLQRYQLPNTATNVSMAELSTSQHLRNSMNEPPSGQITGFPHPASRLYSPFSPFSTSGTFPPLESQWESGYLETGAQPLPNSLPDGAFSSVPALDIDGLPTTGIQRQRHSDSQLFAESSQRRGFRRNSNSQCRKTPYGPASLPYTTPGKHVADTVNQFNYAHMRPGRALSSNIGFYGPEPSIPQHQIQEYQSLDWASNLGVGNSPRNLAGHVFSGRNAYPAAEFNMGAKTSIGNTSVELAGNLGYGYPQKVPNDPQSATEVLSCITSRPDPGIDLGTIDMSCAFTISRITDHDYPIVYASGAFCRLTGYSHEEAVGRDCRFLQEPTGKVEPGLKHKNTDDRSVRHLKVKIHAKSEVQECLINYRKGGQPFLNLLTVVPIRWYANEYNYSVGFQIDLLDNPQAITGRNNDGSYIVNYRRVQLAPNIHDPGGEIGSRSAIPKPQGSKGIDLNKSADQKSISFGSQWDRVLLGSPEFLFHIISAEGEVLYVAPTVSSILEYEPKELAGSTISSICHPSDIVTVIRELRDSEPGSAVNLLYRIRRKISGYAWFESLGSVYIDTTQQQKHLALLGKVRVVFSMSRDELMENGGINEGEIWAKISTSGILLFVSSSARAFLDRRSEDLVGERIQNLLNDGSHIEFENALGVAQSGKRASCKHELLHRRGHLLQVQSTIYPGQSDGGSKPMFLILQIRLLKLGRSVFTLQTNAPTRTQKKEAVVSHQPAPQGILPTFPGQQRHGNQQQHIGPSSTKVDATTATTASTNIFEELNPTRTTSWQTELDHLIKRNRSLAEELQYLTSLKKKRKRKKDLELPEKDCSQCHTKSTPEWRRGPSGNRDLCNSCGLRWAKQMEDDKEGSYVFFY